MFSSNVFSNGFWSPARNVAVECDFWPEDRPPAFQCTPNVCLSLTPISLDTPLLHGALIAVSLRLLDARALGRLIIAFYAAVLTSIAAIPVTSPLKSEAMFSAEVATSMAPTASDPAQL